MTTDNDYFMRKFVTLEFQQPSRCYYFVSLSRYLLAACIICLASDKVRDRLSLMFTAGLLNICPKGLFVSSNNWPPNLL